MNKLTKIAIVAAGVALASRGAYAANGGALIFDVNDNTSGSTEYDVNLGTLSSLLTQAAAGGGSVNLNSDVANFGTYNSATAGGLNVGVAAGLNGQGGATGAGNFVVTTTLDGSGAPTPGSTAAPSKNAIETAGGIANGFAAFGANTAVSGSGSFSSIIAQTPTANGTATTSFTSKLGGDNPLSAMTGNSITLDVWEDTTTTGTANTGWVEEGTLTFTLPAGSSPADLQFSEIAVPEPSTYGLLGGLGLLALSLRRQLIRKNA